MFACLPIYLLIFYYYKALRADGLSDEDIAVILGINSRSLGQNTHQASRVDLERPRDRMNQGTSVADSELQAEPMDPRGRPISDIQDPSDTDSNRMLFTEEEQEDGDADMNMAILLSIQDPRLNDRTIRRADGSIGGRSTLGLPATAAATPARSGVVSVTADPHKVATLTAMGFSDIQATEALLESSNDVEVAIHSLLSG